MPNDDLIPPISPKTRRRGARDALIMVAVATLLLAIVKGPEVKASGKGMDHGPIRSVVLAIGTPLAAVTEHLPFNDAVDDATAFLDPDNGDQDGPGGFAATVNETSGVPQVTTAAITPQSIGAPAAPKRELKRIIVTGDSMTQPMDAVIARRLADSGIDVDREVHIGTAISKTDLLDWGKLSFRQAQTEPSAVIIFIGANEGFPFGATECCNAEWAAAYATRARQMMDTYRRDGQTKVYWALLPLARDADNQLVDRTVNGATRAAQAAYARDVHLLDFTTLFTPGDRFRESMDVDGKNELVRTPDGKHLNETGAELAADVVMGAMAQDFSNLP